MNTKVQNMVETENGMAALSSTLDKNVDLFFRIGSMRNTDPIPQFSDAFNENKELAIRILLWARDIRKGAGERETFKKILKWLEGQKEVDFLERIIPFVPEMGRWDDLLIFETEEVKNISYNEVRQALHDGNGLAAKWMPRKGPISIELRNYLNLSPKAYRKLLVKLTKVVESQMCDKKWDEIEYSHVPSVAMSRYRQAFGKHDSDRFSEYLDNVNAGQEKINASAIFPYDVLRPVISYYSHPQLSTEEANAIIAQWNNLPNYLDNNKILPIVDVSGSMDTPISGKLTAMAVAVSLGLYVADKQKGPFKDLALTFSHSPSFFNIGECKNIIEKASTMAKDRNWGMDTNLELAMETILGIGLVNNVKQDDMPKYLMILSDMQFNSCVETNDTAMDMIKNKYIAAGYTIPKVIFWNLNAKIDNFPVSFDEEGTVLISGFSPNIVKNVLAGKKLDPQSIMLETIMNDRYNIWSQDIIFPDYI